MIRKIVAVGLALLLVGAGVAFAAPGNAPTDAPANDNAQASSHGNSGQGNGGADAANASNNTTDRGPPTDMPAQVPDHVIEIHRTINSWLAGDLTGSLGEHISSIVGGNQEVANPGGNNTTETATPTPTGNSTGS